MTPEELDALRAEAQEVLVTAPASEWLADRLLVVIDALREARAALDQVRAECDETIEHIHREKRELTAIVVKQRAALDRVNALLRYAFHLRMNGERAPGGNETWAQFDRDIEHHLRAAIEGSE